MRFLSFLCMMFLLQSQTLCAQDMRLYPFSVEGNINADTGVARLNILFDPEYYPQGVEDEIVAEVKDKKFLFRGYIPYPQGVTLSYGDAYYSDIFVIEPGSQSMICDTKAVREIPQVKNQSMEEYEKEYVRAFASIREKREVFSIKSDSLTQLYEGKIPDSIKLDLEQELKGYYAEGDSALLKYVATHPDSYIAFWKFIYLFSGFGYESIFDSILTQFSDSLKNTYAGEVLARKLNVAGLTGYGKPLPFITAINSQNEKLDHADFLKNKFTFIDFWFSNCGPCIAQFPHLKDTYAKYKDKGFEIVGISTDRTAYKENWQRAIQKHALSWPQYWDQNGVASSKLSINKFPTNFLLDSQGNIIKKDLRPVELEQFLEENVR